MWSIAVSDGGADEVELEESVNISKTVLQLLWGQDPVRTAMPWLPEPPDEKHVHTESTRCSRFSKKAFMAKIKQAAKEARKEYDETQKSIFEFHVVSNEVSQNDYDHNNRAFSRSMQTRIDLGAPTQRAERGLIAASILNALLGTIHRTYFVPEEQRSSRSLWNTDFGLEHTLFIATSTCTVFASWYVYRTIYCTALRWYTCLMFSEQLVSTLSMAGAITDYLPCYIDLRHTGNMEGWYRCRKYFTQYTDVHVFGMKDQIVVASALVMSTIISGTAVVKYFGDATNIDWSDPGPLIALLNMAIIGSLVFLAMAALERLNAQTGAILGKLDEVAIEVSRTTNVEQSVMERAMETEAASASIQLDDDDANRDDDAEFISDNTEQDGSGGGQPDTRAKQLSSTKPAATLRAVLEEEEEMGVEVEQIEARQHKMQETLTNIGHHLDAKLSHLADVTKAHGQNIGEIAQMQKISAEAVYLANIMSELRDHPCVH